MSNVAKLKPDTDEAAPRDPLARMRDPFTDGQISKLPKPTKAQTEAVKTNYKAGIRCKVCGSWHHPDVVHLDYVGHAALTHRLLDVDPHWSWEPLAFRDGLPAFDQSGGLWIKLTICGVTRLGYGHAAMKTGQDPGAREKEVIGDALRNAAMRFGAALDLWHKGDLHADEPTDDGSPRQSLAVVAAMSAITVCDTLDALKAWHAANADAVKTMPDTDYLTVLNHYKTRFAALKDRPAARAPEPERGGEDRAYTRGPRHEEAPRHPPANETPFDDEIPF